MLKIKVSVFNASVGRVQDFKKKPEITDTRQNISVRTMRLLKEQLKLPNYLKDAQLTFIWTVKIMHVNELNR